MKPNEIVPQTIRFFEKSLVCLANVVGIHTHHKLVGHRVDRQQHSPALFVRSVDPRLHEDSADFPFDDLLFDKLQGLVSLAVQPVCRERQKDVDLLRTGQQAPETVQACPLFFESADSRVEEDVFARDENAESHCGLKDRSVLIGNRVLESGTVAGVSATNELGIFARQLRMELSDDEVDFSLGVFPPSLPLSLRFFAAAGSLSARLAMAGLEFTIVEIERESLQSGSMANNQFLRPPGLADIAWPGFVPVGSSITGCDGY